MIGFTILFKIKDDVKSQMDKNAVEEHLSKLVKEYKNVPGLKEKTFFMNPENLDQGALLIWETQAQLDAYLKSALYKTAVLDICEGEPRCETYIITATLKDGVVF